MESIMPEPYLGYYVVCKLCGYSTMSRDLLGKPVLKQGNMEDDMKRHLEKEHPKEYQKSQEKMMEMVKEFEEKVRLWKRVKVNKDSE